MDRSKLTNNKTDAKAAGDRHFYTNKLCKNGHDAVRVTSSGACVECRKDYQRERAQIQRQDPNYRKYQAAYQAKYRLSKEGADRIKAAQDTYREKKKNEKDLAKKRSDS